MGILIILVVFGLLIFAFTSRHSTVRMIARIFSGLLTVLSLAGMVWLFGVGQKAHWSSDGPGMLLIIGVALCGLFVFVFGSLTVTSSQPEPRSPLNLSELMTPSHVRSKELPPRR